MAGNFNPVSFISYQDPAKGLKLQQQIALAQQLMEQGKQSDDINKLANPGGFVVPYSPLQGLSKMGSSIAGSYLQQKALAEALQQPTSQAPDMMGTATNAAINAEGGEGPATAQDVASKYQQGLASVLSGSQGGQPTAQEMYLESFAPGMGRAQFEERMKLQNAGAIKAAETGSTPYVTPQGTYVMGSQLMGDKQPSKPNFSAMMPPSLQQGMANQGGMTPPPAPPSPPMNPTQAQGIQDVLGDDADKPAAPVDLTNKSGNSPDSEPALAADGKQLLPNIQNIPAPDPTGTPKFKTENTKTGVEQTIQDQKDAAEGNKAFAATAQSLGQEKARLDNLIQVYKDVQSGTLTAQNPELFNRLAALGFHDSPQQIKDLAGIQNATQNHILQVIQQIKDTNANAGGGAPTRVFGSEISQLLENGESTKGQPEALWNVIGQAKGVVDHHLDMVNGWQKAGGLGNRLAGGYTMRPDDFATQFSTNHNISDYRDKALKEIGPFKGMAGNNGVTPPAPQIGFISKGHKFLGGDPSSPQSWEKVP